MELPYNRYQCPYWTPVPGMGCFHLELLASEFPQTATISPSPTSPPKTKQQQQHHQQQKSPALLALVNSPGSPSGLGCVILLLNTPHPWVKEHGEIRLISGVVVEDGVGRKIVRARGDGWVQESGVFWTQQGCWTEELTMGMTASARPVQAEADEIPAQKREAQSPSRVRHLIATRRGRVSFLWDCHLWQVDPLSSWKAGIYIWAVQWYVMGQKREGEHRVGCVRKGGGRRRRSECQNTL